LRLRRLTRSIPLLCGILLTAFLGPATAGAVVSPLPLEGRVAAGLNHTCALANDGTVWCWGTDSYGQLGDGAPGLVPRYGAQRVVGVSRATAVVAGQYHTCALLANGTVQCWGRNNDHQLGDGTNRAMSATPASVVGVSDAVALTAGLDHTCALLSDETVKCWGDDMAGGLLPVPHDPIGAVTIAGLAGVSRVSAGANDDCAMLDDGSVKCWGLNTYGQLGDGTLTSSATPVSVTGLDRPAVDIAAGTNVSCAVLDDGSGWCWGRNRNKELGPPSDPEYSAVPLQVQDLADALGVTASKTICALIADQTLRCWGEGNHGEIGNGAHHDQYPPNTPIGIAGAVALSAGGEHVCAALADNTVDCWGDYSDGAVGVQSPFLIMAPVPAAGFDAGPVALGNDTRGLAQWITQLPFSDTVDMSMASAGGDELQASCAPSSIDRTAWYRYVSDYDRSLAVGTTTAGASVAVFADTGAGFDQVACATNGSDATFEASGSQAYYVQLAGDSTIDSATVELGAAGSAPNDDFADATNVTALPFADTVDTTTATLEPSEPRPSCAPDTPPFNSVWYRYDAPADGALTVSASGYPARVGVYTGASLASLAEEACLGAPSNDGRFNVTGGVTYYLQVFGVGASGDLSVAVDEAPPIDTTPPVIDTPPVPTPDVDVTMHAAYSTLSWSGHDDDSGVAYYELQRWTNNGWKTVATPATPSATTRERLGRVQRFRVRAFDNQGNVSDWTIAPAYTPILKQESWRKLGWQGGWVTRSVRGASGGALRWTSHQDATATFTFTGRAFQWVSLTAPDRGVAQITVDGDSTLVDLSSASTVKKWIAFTTAWAADGTHTVEIRNTTNLRIDFDALIIFR
jgi:hypothetical protein